MEAELGLSFCRFTTRGIERGDGVLDMGRPLVQLMGSQYFPRVEEELGREREG